MVDRGIISVEFLSTVQWRIQDLQKGGGGELCSVNFSQFRGLLKYLVKMRGGGPLLQLITMLMLRVRRQSKSLLDRYWLTTDDGRRVIWMVFLIFYQSDFDWRGRLMTEADDGWFKGQVLLLMGHYYSFYFVSERRINMVRNEKNPRSWMGAVRQTRANTEYLPLSLVFALVHNDKR